MAIPPSSGELVHRALSSPARSRIVELLSADDRPRDASELAEQLGLHVSTVRAHLAVLIEAGLVVSSPHRRDQPGRPRLLYRATEQPAERDSRGYRFLAEVLAGQLTATADDPAAVGEQAGAAWGRHLVDGTAPFTRLTPSEAIDRVVALLEEFGFAPERDDSERDDAEPDTRILLRRCPFREVAREHPDVVCAIHLGIMRGALERLDADVEVRDLIPFVEAGLCVSHLEVPA